MTLALLNNPNQTAAEGIERRSYAHRRRMIENRR